MEALKKVNDGVYAVERVLVVAALVIMAVVVFFDVVHRRYTDAESKLVGLLLRLSGSGPDTETWTSVQAQSGWFIAVGVFVLMTVGLRTASTRPLWASDGKERQERPERRLGLPLAAAVGLGITVAAWVFLRLLFGMRGVDPMECVEGGSLWTCGVFPYGIIWSQPFALVLTIWVGFLGASMASHDYRHLKVEAVVKRLPEGAQRIVGLVGGIVTAGFCLLVAYLSYLYVADQYGVWIETEYLGALFDGTEIPRWRGFAVIPIAYTLMAFRFVGTGVLAYRGELEEVNAELGDIDLDEIDATGGIDVDEDGEEGDK